MSAVVMMLRLVFVDGAVLHCRLCASPGVAPHVAILSGAPAIDTLHDHLGAPPVRLRWMSRLLECATYRWYNTLTSAEVACRTRWYWTAHTPSLGDADSAMLVAPVVLENARSMGILGGTEYSEVAGEPGRV